MAAEQVLLLSSLSLSFSLCLGDGVGSACDAMAVWDGAGDSVTVGDGVGSASSQPVAK